MANPTMTTDNSDRRIYKCPVTGTCLDPLAVRRRLLLGSQNEINGWLRDHRSPDTLISLQADEKLLPVTRSAFGIKPVDPKTGGGVTDNETLRALGLFLGWLAGKAERGQNSPGKSPCLDCPQT